MPSWLGGFANPALVWGMALASVPLLIHLLNRQRYKPMPWAAMRFVLAAYRRTRRRVELENLLLLLLRMAAVALLALAVARPFTGDKSPLARLTESRRDVLLVLDGSASMGAREGLTSSFERALTRARDLARSLEGGRGDRLRVILAGSYPRLLAATTPEAALSVLETVDSPTDEPLDLAAALGEVLKHARDATSGVEPRALEVHLLTDMQRRAFITPEPDAASTAGAKPVGKALYEVLEELNKLSVRVLVEDFGPSERLTPNLGIDSVRPQGEIDGPRLPCDIAVGIQNHGANGRSGVSVTLSIDGERRPSQQVDVPARGRAETIFPVSFARAGEHLLVATLESDRLAVDDERAAVVIVPPPVRVLLVDGSPGVTIDEDATGYLAAVLEPSSDGAGSGLGASAPFEPRVVPPSELAASDMQLGSYDVIWLANVQSLSSATADKLERAVADGSALVISLGDTVDLENYRARLYRPDGSGLLPAELLAKSEVPSRRDSYYRVKRFEEEHPALAFFADERWKMLFTEVPIYACVRSRPLSDARVLATLDDESSSPLLIERRYVLGKVFLWTTTIDPSWTRLAESPRTLVPLVHELLRYAARVELPPRNVAPGEPLESEVDKLFPRSLYLVNPAGTRVALEGEPKQRERTTRWTLPAVDGKQTEHVGAYRIERENGPPLAFAVQFDAREGDLERIEADELAHLHPALVPVASVDRERHSDEPQTPERGELWRLCAALCLAAAVMESLWAAWLGAKRSVRK